MPRQPDSRQLDLFVAFIGDLPLRDEREAMSLPFCSLSKRKRIKPIEFTNRDGSRWCRVTANPKFGMATIYDLDVMMWAISQLNEAVENGLKTSPTISFQPYDLLKSIGRQTGGDHYKRLEAALQRLQSTSIETTIRADQRRRTTMFSWLDWWQHDVDEATGRSKGMKITVPNWLYQAVVGERAVLAVVPEYFALTGGIERWLYRLARRHAGKQVGGWRFTMRSLWERSGSSQPLPQFARDVRKVIARNALPEYHLELGRGQKGDEIVTLVPDPMRVTGPPRRDIAKHELLGN